MDRIPDRDTGEGVGMATEYVADGLDMADPFARPRFRVVRDEKRAPRGVGPESREGGA